MSDETKSDQPATAKDLVDSALNFGTNLLTTLDIPASVVKNVYKALGQLSSAAIEIPIASLKGKAAEIRAESEGRVKIIAEGTDQIIQQMEVPSEYAQVAVDKYVGKIIGEQLNLDKISAIAVNELKSAEPISSTTQNTSEPIRDQSADSINQEVNASEEKTISDVWLNNFETVARPQSTEDMQILFGRILAGEIKQPGSYSIRAIKILVELNQDTAVLFKKLCSLCVVLESPDDGSILDARVASLGGDAAQNALSRYGLGFDQLNILNEYGLIISDYNSWLSYNVYRGDENNLEFLLFQHQGKYWNLLPLPEQINNREFKLSGVALSRAGRELFRIIDQEPMEKYTKDLENFLERQNIQMIEIPVQ